jgi:ADP-ribose pyrophosphatase
VARKSPQGKSPFGEAGKSKTVAAETRPTGWRAGAEHAENCARVRYNRRAIAEEELKRAKNQARVVSSEVAFQGRMFGVRRDRVVEPSGVEVTREVVTHPGSVVVLPVFPDGRILLIRQYRHAVGQYLWELVAGSKDEGESFAQGAKRELEEETGYSTRKLTQILDIFPSPGFVSENMVIFVAEGLTKGTARPEADEKITQRIVTLRDVEAWIRSGKIRDAKSAAGILYYSRFLARSENKSKSGT